MNARFNIAKALACASRIVLKNVLKRPGGFFPGKLALKVDKDVIHNLTKKIDGESIVVTGTNGKTSVTALIAQCLNKDKIDVVTNSSGANLASGVASSLLEHDYSKVFPTYTVFEVDEMWVDNVVSQLNAKYLLLLNLFPDQVDRMGSISNIQDRISDALKHSPSTTLIYNADDPNCQYIADNTDNDSISFGMLEKISKDDEEVKELCPKCQNQLTYSIHQYAQLGNYKCNKCGFNKAKLDFGAKNISLTAKRLSFEVNNTKYTSNNSAEYITYNLLGYIAATTLLKCKQKYIKEAIKEQKNDKGRLQYFNIKDKTVMINLAKNPAGFNQNIKYILNQGAKRSSLIAFFVNAKEGDGFDTSWLKDVHFEKLKGYKIVYGGEAKDVLANILQGNSVENAHDVLKYSDNYKKVYIIANYTAMFPLREELIKMENK